MYNALYDSQYVHVCSLKLHISDEISTGTKIANSLAIALFFGGFCFGMHILRKYLITNAKEKQWTMIIFYSLILFDILGRISFFLVSCFIH